MRKSQYTHFWLSFLQNESDMKIIHLKMKVKLITLLSDLKHTTWRSLAGLIGKHIATSLFLPKRMLATKYDREAHFVIVRQKSP